MYLTVISLIRPCKVDVALVTALNVCGNDVQYCLTACTYIAIYKIYKTSKLCVFFDFLVRSGIGWDRGSEKSLILQRGRLGVTAIERIYRPMKCVISPHQRTVLRHAIFDLQLLLLNKMRSMPSCIMAKLLQFNHIVCIHYINM